MSKSRMFSTAIVLVHFVIATVHGAAHSRLMIELTANQQLFVVTVIVAAPLVALALAWTRWARAGAALLILSMLGSLIFGVVNHYVIASPDHVSHLPAGLSALVFKITAALLVVTELLGCVIGWAGLRARQT